MGIKDACKGKGLCVKESSSYFLTGACNHFFFTSNSILFKVDLSD